MYIQEGLILEIWACVPNIVYESKIFYANVICV